MLKIFFPILINLRLLVSCKMPTLADLITSSCTSGTKYENYRCDWFAIEINSSAREEDRLLVSGRQRIKLSTSSTSWICTGDGLEALELKIVKCEKVCKDTKESKKLEEIN